MTEQLVIIHDPQWKETYPDDTILFDFLQQHFTLSIQNWQDIKPESLQGKKVLIRHPLDYISQNDAFLVWLYEVQKIASKMVNSSPVITRYCSKQYLLDLQVSEFPVVPTLLLEHQTNWEIVCEHEWAEIILKPLTGESSMGIKKVSKDTEFSSIETLIKQHGPYLAQEYLSSIASGEISAIIIDNKLQYCVKRELKDPENFSMDWENCPEYEPSLLLQEEIRKVLAFDDFSGSYVRLDWIQKGEKFLLSEIEVVDPVLFLKSIKEEKQKLILDSFLRLFKN